MRPGGASHAGHDNVLAVAFTDEPGREVVLAKCDVGWETYEMQDGCVVVYGASHQEPEPAIADFKTRANR